MNLVQIHDADLPRIKSSYREAAAWHLYEIVRPAGGLKWNDLSNGQRQVYRNLIDQAAAQTAVVLA